MLSLTRGHGQPLIGQISHDNLHIRYVSQPVASVYAHTGADLRTQDSHDTSAAQYLTHTHNEIYKRLNPRSSRTPRQDSLARPIRPSSAERISCPNESSPGIYL